jgi:hypothetical protein
VKRAEREFRDAQVVGLFVAGQSYRQIAAAVGLRSPQSVGNIVERSFARSPRRDLLSDEFFAVWQERSESLLQAHWGKALEGEHKSSELCLRLLGHQARVYGLTQQPPVAGTRRDAVESDRDDDGQDELARLRAARAKRFAF